MRPIDKVFMVFSLRYIFVLPPVFEVFVMVVFVIEVDVCWCEGGFLHDDGGIGIALDGFFLLFGIAVVCGIDTDAFTLVAAIADGMKEVLAKASPASVYYRCGKLFAGMRDILVVHPYFIARQISAVIIKHGKVCRGGIE